MAPGTRKPTITGSPTPAGDTKRGGKCVEEIGGGDLETTRNGLTRDDFAPVLFAGVSGGGWRAPVYRNMPRFRRGRSSVIAPVRQVMQSTPARRAHHVRPGVGLRCRREPSLPRRPAGH